MKRASTLLQWIRRKVVTMCDEWEGIMARKTTELWSSQPSCRPVHLTREMTSVDFVKAEHPMQTATLNMPGSASEVGAENLA